MPTQAGTNNIVVVLGKKGSGKSTALQHMVFDRRRERIVPVVMVDFLGDAQPLFDVVECNDSSDWRAYFDKEDTDIIIYDPTTESDKVLMANIGAELGFIGQKHEPISDIILVMDELDFPSMVNAAFTDIAIRRIISYGRHYSIDLYSAARRPQDIPKVLLSQADIILCGQLATDRDRKHMEQYGFDPEMLKSLKVGQFAVMVDSQVQVKEFEKIW